jgi:hypothetical protein
LISHIGVTLLALVVAEGCKVSTTSDDTDGGAGKGSGGQTANDGGDKGGAGGTAGASGGSAGSGGGGTAGATTGGAAGASVGGTDGGGVDSGTAAGGAVNDGGPGGDAGLAGDPCGTDETKPNDDRDHPTAYALGTDFHACLQKKDDVDYYSFDAPAAPAQGGYFIVSATEVGTNGNVRITPQAVVDNGDITSPYGSNGESVFAWFNAKSGASFHVKVTAFTGSDTPVPYTLRVVYKGVPDANEPNDTRATATPMIAGTPIHGYEFAGFENSTNPPDAAWQDWFKVTLGAGTATVTLSDVGADVNGDVTLYDTNGSLVAREYATELGASVVVTKAVTAGDYYVKVNPFTDPANHGTTSTVPAYLSQPYTLTATVK